MTDHKPVAMLENYLRAFTEPAVSVREQLIRSSVADDVQFSNPGVNGSGVDNLLRHSSFLQQRFSGSHFRINWSRQQHNQAHAEWTQVNQDSSGFLTAHSYARVNDEGQIINFAGFRQEQT